MEGTKKFMLAAGLAVGGQTSPEDQFLRREQFWLHGLIKELERPVEMYGQYLELGEQIGKLEQEKEIDELQEKMKELEVELGEPYTITAPSCLSKGGLSDIAKVLNALPWTVLIDSLPTLRVELDLSEVTGLTYIAPGVFTHCEALQSVKLPLGIIEIGQHAFSRCSNLERVEIPAGVTTIGNSAFSDCSNLTSVTIAEGVTTIGDSAFSRCSNLESVEIPASVTTIGWHAFSHCSNLESVEIPASVTTIGKYAFSDCDKLTVTIPASVASIDNKEKFVLAAGLAVGEQVPPEEQIWLRGVIAGLEEQAELHERIETLEKQVKKLEQVEAPQGEIEELQRQIAGLEEQIEETHSITAPSCLSKGGLLDMARVLDALPAWMEIRVGLDLSEVTGLTYIAAGAFTHCEALQSVKIPPSVIEIGQHAFSWCRNLESVTIPSSVATVGDNAFSQCVNLTSVTIPASVAIIGDNAFGGCSNLEGVDIAEGVTTIGDSAFSWCRNLRSVTFPASVTTIGNFVFWGCNLTSVTFQKTDGWHLQDPGAKVIDAPIDVSKPEDNATNITGQWFTKYLTRVKS